MRAAVLHPFWWADHSFRGSLPVDLIWRRILMGAKHSCAFVWQRGNRPFSFNTQPDSPGYLTLRRKVSYTSAAGNDMSIYG